MASVSKRTFALVGTIALVALGLVAIAGKRHARSIALMSGDGGKLNAFLARAEQEMNSLKREMPAGDAARGFPKVASEIQGALSQSRSGLQNVAEELTESEKQNAKRAQLQSLVQRAKQAQDAAMARAKHGKMYRYVEKANRMMATLSRQLPRKDAEMFPKEAHELNQVFGAEMKKLGSIEEQIMHEAATQKPGVAAKARRAQALAAARGSQAEQARLDADVAKDREENRRLSGKADMDSFFNSINKEEQSIRASKSGLSTLPGAVKKARTTTLLRSRNAKKGGLEQSGTQQWGKVFNPMMPSGRKGNADMTPQGTKEFNTYAHEATMYNNVHDPAKDGHDDTHGNWWAAGMPSSHGRSDQWWEHKAHKKGYFA